MKFIFGLMILLFSAEVLFAQQLPLDPAVLHGRLGNGFSYYIRRNKVPEHRVSIYFAVKAGSVLEDNNQRGLAHFMEHMNFKGTRHFPKNQLIDLLQRSGVRFGADINATTGYDETIYQLPLPTDTAGLLEKGLDIVRDWAAYATLNPEAIDKERGVVLEEKRIGKGADERMRRQYLPLLLNGSRYADRSPIGKDEVLQHFKPETIRRFYQEWYRPDLEAVIVVGDIDPQMILRLVKAKFAGLHNPIPERRRINYTIPLREHRQFIALTDPELTYSTIQLCYKFPSLQLRTRADYRKIIIRNLFNQLTASRLADLSRQAGAPFIQAQAVVENLLGPLDDYHMTVVMQPDAMQKGIMAALGVAERIRRYGFTPSELTRAKAGYQRAMDAAVRAATGTGSDAYAQEYVAHFLNGVVPTGITYAAALVKKELKSIGPAELRQFASSIMTGPNLDIVITAPAKAKNSLPDSSQVSQWIKTAELAPMAPYRDTLRDLPLLKITPVPGRIVRKSTDQKLGVTTWTLSNGVTVCLKPTELKPGEVLFNAFSPGGTSLSTDQNFPSANAAGSIIPSFGAGNYGPALLEKFLAGKNVLVQPYIGELTQGVTGNCSVTDLETAMQLTYARYTQPRKDTALFRNIIDQSRPGLLNRGSDPIAVFQDTISAVLGNYSLRRTGPTAAKLDQIKLDSAFAFYQSSFKDASGTTFVFTGDLDTVRLRPLVEKYLASLPASGHTAVPKDLHLDLPAGRIFKTVYKGAEPIAIVGLFWSGSADYKLQTRLSLDALKECLQFRLTERLRQAEGGAYSPRASVNINKYPDCRYLLSVQFVCAPENADRLIADVAQEINMLQTNGPSLADILKWREESRRLRETQVQTNDWWLDYLSGQILNNEDLHENDRYIPEMHQIDSQAVKSAAQKYLSGLNYIQLVLKPENANK